MAYSKLVMEHFLKPKNRGIIKNPSGVGTVGNPVCGDLMRVYIKVKKNKADQKIISDIKFETLGCAAAIATSSMVTELAKNKTLLEAEKITNKQVAGALEGLPPIKMHCSNLAASALKDAIRNYFQKNHNLK
ncbi:MAG: iron-sulfur cluster assembly scaffold protein [Patescibacteria group bacterium]|nr:iron-sulfur cluster assembly scaffold protein [Patescibacteria group bacterium]